LLVDYRVPAQYSIAATDLPKYAAMFDAVGLLACAIGALHSVSLLYLTVVSQNVGVLLV